MKKLLTIFVILFLVSCGNGVKKLDDEYLGTIKKNKPYSTVITLPERVVNELSFSIQITPNDSGFIWFVKDETLSPGIKNYDNIFIEGRPNVSGEVYMDFRWSTYGTNIRTGRKFQKRYILKVEE